jgi:diguanylate cyclase (GGDEF)-like protein
VWCEPAMPSPGALAPLMLPIEDSFLELLSETLESLDLGVRGQFLQRYFRTLTHLDLPESDCVQIWDNMLTRRTELGTQSGRPVSMKAALMDVLTSSGQMRIPVIIEYDELKKLQMNAVTDPLTGLYNRRHFGESFEKELNRARRYSSPLGLVILDMHRFKEVNDKHGHPRGDEVLRAVATTLRKALRTSDSAFRMGGDEFALLLPQTDAPQANALSRRIESVFAEILKPLQLEVPVSMDHGVANFPEDGDETDALIQVADERLYRIKHANHSRSSDGGQTSELPATEPQPPPAPIRHRGPLSSSSAPAQMKRPPDKTEPGIEAAASATTASIAADITLQPSRIFSIQRKAERVSMAGTNAYAVLGDQGSRRARVLDLGFGGVAIELDSQGDLPENLLAILHVPILPPVRVNLKPVWIQPTPQGGCRVGCAFVS